MLRETIELSSKEQWLELRSRDVTSTEVAALFNASPYTSYFELWNRKKNNIIVEIEENNRMKWGSRLEKTIAEGIGEDYDLKVTPFKSYMRLPELRIGSSFDYQISEPLNAILEIKNVDSLQFKDQWLVEDGKVTEAPVHIEFQCQVQMLVSDIKTCYIGAFVGGNNITLLIRERDDKICEQIIKKCAEFWKSIDENRVPSPVTVEDYRSVISLNKAVAEGRHIEDFSEELFQLMNQYKKVSENEKQLSETKDILKAKILMRVGDAEKVKGENFSLNLGTVKETQMNYTRSSYRTFKPYWRKEK